MEPFLPTVMAIFYIAVIGGYAWATSSRLWRKEATPASQVLKAEVPRVKLSKKAEAQPQPLPRPQTPPSRVRRFFLFPRKTAAAAPKQVVSYQKTEPKAEQKAAERAPPATQAQQVPIPTEGQVLIDNYIVREPFVRIGISQEPDGSNRYRVIEPRLTSKEKSQLAELKETLKNGLEIDVAQFDPAKAVAFLSEQTKEIMKRFGVKVPKDTYEKLFYFIERDFLHFGKIDPIMRDPNIEDISCNGPGLPVYVFHRTYESIPTNVSFKTQEELEKFVLRLAYMSGRNISVAEPMVDASLPDGSRVQLTFGSEITKKGSTFTIRKFKEDPFSIIDLIKFGTITPEIAALMWYALENKSSILLAGGTASGKSIAGNEPVFIYDNGSSRVVKISELFNSLAMTRPIMKEGGYETVTCGDIQTAAFDKDLKIRPFRVHSVIRHPAPRKMFKVRTRTGRESTLTGDHSAFTLIDGVVCPYPVSRLEPGMFLAIPRILPESRPGPGMLDLIEAFSTEDYGLYVENAMPHVRRAIEILGKEEVERLLGLGHRTFLQALRADSMTVRISKLAKLSHAAGFALDAMGMRLRAKNYRRGAIPAAIPVSADLMRLLGYWVAEGKYGRGLEIYNLDRQVRSDVHRLAKALFELKVKNHRTDVTRMSINSKPLDLTFRRVFGLEQGSGRKTIPPLVFEQSNDMLAEFLSGYYTGDGSVGTSIEATTKSRILAEQLLVALTRFGIVARVAPKVVSGITYHRVSIYGRKNMQIFSERVGFLDRERQRKLSAQLRRTAAPHTNVDTIPGIGPLLKQVLRFKTGQERKQLWSGWHSYWSSEKRIGQQALVSYLREAGAAGELRERLLTLAYSEIFWDEVVEVEEVGSEEDYVYDLEVPSAQNFVGGRGGLLLHNTTTINCLALFIRPEAKIVTLEDTPEINLAHKNWIQSISRQGMAGTGEVTLYDLLRAALRQRPDFIVPGEVRGEEAQTMFQAISTGHAGMSSIHADSVPAVFHRLTNPPMNIPRTLLPALNFVLLQSRVTLRGKPTRRILSVTEVVGLDTRSNELITNELYRYNLDKDEYVYSGRSYILEKLAKTKGITLDELRQELATREQILRWMADRGLRRYREVASIVQRYYTDRPGLLAELGAVAA